MLNSILLHWRALCILYGSLLASIAFAVGHHFHYQSLAGQPVSTANDLAIGTWAGVSSQKFNTAVGNTFASLFRTFLSITVTTAYCQIVWHALKSEATRLNIVDAISGILANPLGFLNLGAWRKSALLFPLAIMIWILPVAPIITPATLTVAINPRTLHDMVNVSSIDFNSMNFATITLGGPTVFGCAYHYDGPKFEVQKIATAATAQGAVLPLSAPGNQPNVSYTQQFAGPALQCTDVRDPLRGEILVNVNTGALNTSTSYGYLAWAPFKSSLPFMQDPAGIGDEFWHLQQGSATIGPTSDGPLTLFVATFPNFNNIHYGNLSQTYTANATVVQCELVNATYSSSYNWTNGIPELNVTVIPTDKGIFYPPDIDCGRLFFTGNHRDTNALQPLSDYNNTLVQNYAYASVMDAFVKLLEGEIYYPRSPNGLVTTTSVMSTTLGTTQELLAVQNRTVSGTQGLGTLTPNDWPGISVNMQANNTSTLRPTLEMMFQNLTMHLMSSPLLQPDAATPYYPPSVNVTTVTFHTQYAYSAATLWLAYGTAILIATTTVVIACLAIFSSGLSYSSSFSTVLRTSSHASVSTKISREDAVGQDPLPKHLAEATITFAYADANEEEAVQEHLVAKGDHVLQSNGSYSVAVIEAGSLYELDNGNYSQIPYYDFESASGSPDLSTVNGLIDWKFLTTPQTALLNRTIHYARGKCLGGSSARNYMVYNRGTVGTFAKWASLVGDSSWNWDGVYPYYRKSPHFTPSNSHLRAANASVGLVDDTAAFASNGGPLQVSYPNFAQAWSSFFPQGFEEVGIPFLEQGISSGHLDGYASVTLTIDPTEQTRSSSETSFLREALAGTDIVVYTHALAKRILFDQDKRATNVLVDVAGMKFQINVTREIILSAGVFQSPQLLMVSGIGPRATLEEHGIPVVADRPGVGQNMWDNPLTSLSWEVNVETPSVLTNDPSRIYEENEAYITNRTGMLTSDAGADFVGFLKVSNLSVVNISSTTGNAFQSNFPSDWPEVELLTFAVGPNDGVHNFASIALGLLATFSRGNVTIKSSDMADAPIINPALLEDKRDQDLAIAAFKFTRRLAATQSFQRVIIGSEVVPGPNVNTDAEILAYLRQSVIPLFHASCTCKMGMRNDGMAVVDSEAKVIGVEGLRVVDISAFPLLPPGQPQATVYMLAEKIVDMILRDA
ncbi:alcohol oxidase, partial [Aureobasidium melanogenum]